MRVAIYARVSTEEQAQNFSIENQLEHLRKYCEHYGYQVFKEYVDPGWSGTTLERPALTELLNDAKAKLFDNLVVYKLDRLFRSNRHMYNTLAELEELGISFASVTEPFDTSTSMGKAYLGMASTFAEWERNTFIERSRDGLKKAVEKGFYSGGIVAYGYRLNPDTKQLHINAQEATIIRDMFRWLIDNRMTCCSIAQRLNALGVPTRYSKDGRGIRGKATAGIWRPGRVYNMLINPSYKGEWYYGKRSKRRHLIAGKCPAIVDATTFETAQIRLKENNMWVDRTRRRPYLLRGLIKCAFCGHSYTGYYSRKANGKEFRYYRCNRNGNRGQLLSKRCTAPQIRGGLVEDLIWEQISEFIQNPEVIREAIKDKFNACHQAEHIAELTQARHRLQELKEAEKRLLVRYADPAHEFTEEALDGALVEIKVSRRLVLARIKELEEAIISEEEQRRKLQDVRDIIDILRERVKDATFETKRRVFELLVRVIRVGRTQDGTPSLNIVYSFSKDLIEDTSNAQLHSARMSLRLPRRPLPTVHLPTGPGGPLPEAHQWALP